jgi:hypothetical protein
MYSGSFGPGPSKCYSNVNSLSEIGGRFVPMKPSNDHERELARLIDERAVSQGKLDYTAVPAVAAQLEFMMTRSDSEFLIAYLHWRMNNAI